MPADTPQPGETPRSEGESRSIADPDAAWWRGGTDRTAADPAPAAGSSHPARGPAAALDQPAGGTGVLLPPAAAPRTAEAAEAHAAGAQDAAAHLKPAISGPPVLLPAIKPAPAGPAVAPAVVGPAAGGPPAGRPPATGSPAGKPAAAASPAVDRDQADPHRYDPLRPAAGHTARIAAETAAADDVMVLPEPSLQHRPTVPLDRPMPARPRQAGPARITPSEPLPPPTGAPATDARLERLENSPFWRDPVDDTIEVPPGEEPAPAVPRARHRGSGRARKRSGLPLPGQVSLVALSLLTAFFAWVSSEPFWLAVGHGDHGYATTTRCVGDGVTQRCAGRFTAADGRYTITQVRLLGVEGAARLPGAVAPARMVSPDSLQAYVGGTGPLLHLRWMLGFALVLFCGYAISGVTGARRLETPRARRGAVLLSLAAPLALLAGFLAAAY
ncbi:hypothetical protein [Actinoplanes sp. URMC 104]|uniref:hypothetical protein n=1 Tax=Actinoplanes sp. URMC 104 TaxID=3423409 RepID=UPI003F1B0516